MQFIQLINGSKSFYGFQQPDTLDSLLLELLPPIDHKYIKDHDLNCQSKEEVSVYLFQEIIGSLRNRAGFHVPKVQMSNFRHAESKSVYV